MSSALTAKERELISSPYGFAKYLLGIPVYDGRRKDAPKSGREVRCDGKVLYTVDENPSWQRDVFDAMKDSGARVSLRTANGSGKTSTIITGLILWHLATFPNSTVISTAGVDRQVRAQLFPNLRRHAHKLKGWNFNESSLEVTAPNGARWIGFTTDKPERAEGWHGRDAIAKDGGPGPLMIIVDEAKSVPTGIFEAFDRCTYQRILYTSSPGAATGEFWKSQTQASSPFKRFVIPASQCPHADHEKNSVVVGARGEKNPMVRSAVFAEFTDEDASFVLSLSDLERCLQNPPAFDPAGGRRAFCDFAAGGDENVLALREGNRVRVVDAFQDRDTMAAVGRFISRFRELNLAPHEIYADADGLGAPMLDRLQEQGWKINRCRNGSAPDDPEVYRNWGSETWHDGAEEIRRCRVILDIDEDTKMQLCDRRMDRKSDGRLGLESKDDMRRRGAGSPDRADSILGCMRGSPAYAPVDFMSSGMALSLDERMRQELAEEATASGAHDGCFAG